MPLLSASLRPCLASFMSVGDPHMMNTANTKHTEHQGAAVYAFQARSSNSSDSESHLISASILKQKLIPNTNILFYSGTRKKKKKKRPWNVEVNMWQ